MDGAAHGVSAPFRKQTHWDYRIEKISEGKVRRTVPQNRARTGFARIYRAGMGDRNVLRLPVAVRRSASVFDSGGVHSARKQNRSDGRYIHNKPFYDFRNLPVAVLFRRVSNRKTAELFGDKRSDVGRNRKTELGFAVGARLGYRDSVFCGRRVDGVVLYADNLLSDKDDCEKIPRKASRAIRRITMGKWNIGGANA